MIIDPNFKSDYPSGEGNPVPTSVKEKLWEKVYLTHFEYDGSYYYIDKRQESPYGYEYDFWSYNGPNEIQGRITNTDLAIKMTNYINRKKKIERILGKTK